MTTSTSPFRVIPRIIHIQLYGDSVNQMMTKKLAQALSNSRPLTKIELIAVSLNCGPGSIAQAKHCVSLLKDYSRKTGAPVYGFGEDFVLGAGATLLTGLNKCFMNKHTSSGEFGYHFYQLGIKSLLKKYNIEVDTLAQGELKNRLNPAQDLKEVDSAWVQKVIEQQTEELADSIISNRSDQIKDNGLSIDEVRNNILNARFLESKDMLANGLIDDISTFEEIYYKQYKGTKVLDIMKGYFDDRAPKIEDSNSGVENIIVNAMANRSL